MNLKKILTFRLSNHKSEKYLNWIRDKHPHLDPRHILINKKKNDYLIAPIPHEEHQKIHSTGQYDFEELLIISLENLFNYVQELEDEIE